MWRLGLAANSVTALLRMRMRMFSLIVSAGAVPSTWPAAVEIDPPLLTLNTSALPLLRIRSSAPRLPATPTRHARRPNGLASWSQQVCGARCAASLSPTAI